MKRVLERNIRFAVVCIQRLSSCLFMNTSCDSYIFRSLLVALKYILHNTLLFLSYLLPSLVQRLDIFLIAIKFRNYWATCLITASLGAATFGADGVSSFSRSLKTKKKLALFPDAPCTFNTVLMDKNSIKQRCSFSTFLPSLDPSILCKQGYWG